MQAVEVTNHPNDALGIAIASLTLSQMTLKALVQTGLLQKSEALERFKKSIADHEELVAYPANRVAIRLLKKHLGELQAIQEPLRN